MAAVTVSANDIANSALQGEITNFGTLITAAGANGPLAAELTQQQIRKQKALVVSLVSQGSISAATILAGNAAVYTVPMQFSQGPIPL